MGSAQTCAVQSLVALPYGGRGASFEMHQNLDEVTKLLVSGSVLERHTTVGNSPVHENYAIFEECPQVAPDP